MRSRSPISITRCRAAHFQTRSIRLDCVNQSAEITLVILPQVDPLHLTKKQGQLGNARSPRKENWYHHTSAINEFANQSAYFHVVPGTSSVLTNKNKPDEANAAFDKCLAADPTKADAYYWKGVNLVAKATVDKTGKMVAPDGTSEALNKYLELQPEGPYAQGAKDLLGSIGAAVQTSFGKEKKKK